MVTNASASPAATSPDRTQRDQHLADCLARVMRGDATAFEAFYDATLPYAQALGRRFLRDEALEDLLADVYFEVWRIAPRFDPTRGSAVTWLLTLVRSRALDALRLRTTHPSVTLGVDADVTADEGATGEEADPAELLWRGQCTEQLRAALAELSSAERWVLGLAYFRELTHAQIAAATAMPLGTVKSLIHRAQQHLRERLLGLDDKPLAGAAPATATPAATPTLPAGGPHA